MSLIAAGLTSFEEVPEAAAESGSLNLHLNQLRSLAGAGRFSNLKELILSSNGITAISDLEAASRLEVLDLSGNNITRLSGLWGLTSLSDLTLAFNRLESLAGLEALWGPEKHLRLLDLRQNCLRNPADMLFLSGCTALEKVWFRGARGLAYPRDHAANAVCAAPTYRRSVLEAVPWLLQLDDERIAKSEVSTQVSCSPANPSSSAAAALELDENIPDQHHDDSDAAEEAALRAAIKIARQSLESRAPPEAALPSVERVKQLTKTLQEVSELEEHLKEARARNEETEEACRSARQASLRRDLSEIAEAMQLRQHEHEECQRELEALQQQRLPALLEEEAQLESQVASEASAEEAAAKEFLNMRIEARALVEEERAAQEVARSLRAFRACSEGLFDDVRKSSEELARSQSNLARARALQQQAASNRSEAQEELEALRSTLTKEEETSEEQRTMKKEKDEAVWEAGKEVAVEMHSLARELMCLAHEVQQKEVAEQKAAEEESEAQQDLQQRLGQVHTLRTELNAGAERMLVQKQRSLYESESTEARGKQEELQQRVSLRLRGWRSSEEASAKAVHHKEEQLESLQQRLSSHRATLRMADSQSQAGRIILQELRQQLITTRHHENEQLELARSRLEKAKQEEEQAATISQELAEEQTALRNLQVHIRESCVARSLLDAPQRSAKEAREESDQIRAELQETEQENRDCEHRLEARRRDLEEVAAARSSCQEEHEKLEMFVKIKEQMIAHTRRQSEELEVATLRLAASQKERDAAHHKHLEAQCQVIDQCGVRASEYRTAVDCLEEELQDAERALQDQEEGLNFAEEQLETLSVLQEEQDRHESLLAARLREEGRQVVAKAEEAAAQMEKRFLSERVEQASLSEHLETSIESTCRELAGWPARLEAQRQRHEEQRREAREAIAALLRSL